MPKRSDLDTILIIGAGPIVIGQACEFDYSGAQACKALREEGYRVVLVNSNPATIMTDPDMADAVYIEPVTPEVIERIIVAERPQAVLPTMGGQTALNCALALHRDGVLDRLGVELIGATADAIDKAEDRSRFKEAMSRIGLESARSFIAHSLAEARDVQKVLGYPVVIRPSFTMGGSGGGIAYNQHDFDTICTRGLELSPTCELLIEESLLGWKEFEMEVVRDRADNCIIVCSIENFDPMGVHTGDSITVAPAQTLTDREYQVMRNAAIAVLREVGVDTGGSNVQFALNPKDGRMVVIEMNPRVSRSSALASKATGFPIARVAAKLAVGFTLDELRNEITGGATPASFEPALDYVVTKIPRFAFEKFPGADRGLTTQMKSVGEVMAIGRSFQESLQKAIRGLDIGKDGVRGQFASIETIRGELARPGPERLWFVGEAFGQGLGVAEVHELSAIDPWFLEQIEELVCAEQALAGHTAAQLDADDMRHLKQLGFGDRRLATLLGCSETEIRLQRHALGVRPVYKRVDTCANEFASATACLYSTYDDECEAQPSTRRKVMILGGGPNRIGQGIEFDYCCVHAALALREDGYETIMVNCNPETVSTDFDTSDRLYFEALTLEDVLEIAAIERPVGVIVQYGGQTPLKLALALQAAGVPVIGTSPDMIDAAEHRERFQQLLHRLALRQPDNRIARTEAEAQRLAQEVGYPLVVRPSYVLGGRAMEVVHTPADLERYMIEAVRVTPDSPVLLDRYLDGAVEVDVDCVCDGVHTLIGGVMEHVEPAGIHSGDSACSLPPYSLPQATVDEIKRQTVQLARGLQVVGLMNVQFAVQPSDHGDVVYVLEVNPRASRTVPFVSKATGQPLAKIAARCMAGQSLPSQGMLDEAAPAYHNVKESVLPFAKFQGVDTILGPEMKSTGEVMGHGASFGEAFYKAQLAAGVRLPSGGLAYLRVRRTETARAVALGRRLLTAGFTLAASHATGAALLQAGLEVEVLDHEPDVCARLAARGIALLVLSVDQSRAAIGDTRTLRLAAQASGTVCCTTIAAGEAVAAALEHAHTFGIRSLEALHTGAGHAQRAPVRLQPSAQDAAAAMAPVPERRSRARVSAGHLPPLKVFIRQPFTESDERQRMLIEDVLRVIDSANGQPYRFQYLTGTEAESGATFRGAFERKHHLPFTPKNFRDHRLAMLDAADVMINIRVGLSESSAFEMAYHIFQGRRTPLLFLVWKGAPIKTTLLRELEDLVDVTYLEFEHASDLRAGLHQFFQARRLGKTLLHAA